MRWRSFAGRASGARQRTCPYPLVAALLRGPDSSRRGQAAAGQLIPETTMADGRGAGRPASAGLVRPKSSPCALGSLLGSDNGHIFGFSVPGKAQSYDQLLRRHHRDVARNSPMLLTRAPTCGGCRRAPLGVAWQPQMLAPPLGSPWAAPTQISYGKNCTGTGSYYK